MTNRLPGLTALLAGLLAISACTTGSPNSAPAPSVTVTVTETAPVAPSAEPSTQVSPSTSATSGDLSTFVYQVCSVITLYEAIGLFADDVYFQETISGMTRRNSDWLYNGYELLSELSADPAKFSPEQVRVIDAVANDFQDELPFAQTLKRTDDWFEWYDTWMGVMENPQNFESVEDLLRLDASFSTCPLGDPLLVGLDL